MAEPMQSLDQLSALKPAGAPETPKYIQKLDKQGRAYATGKRKNAVARVWVKPGAGKIEINTRVLEVYFARPVLRMLIQQPLVATNRNSQYDIICTVSGGGLSGQAGAVRHGISKALMNFEPDLRAETRDLRRCAWVVEPRFGRCRIGCVRQFGDHARQVEARFLHIAEARPSFRKSRKQLALGMRRHSVEVALLQGHGLFEIADGRLDIGACAFDFLDA